MPQIFKVEEARYHLIEELVRFNRMSASDEDHNKVILLKIHLAATTSTEAEKQYERIVWLSTKIEEYIELVGINYRIRQKNIMIEVIELANSLAPAAIAKNNSLSPAHNLSILLGNLHNHLTICSKDQTTISDGIILLGQSPRSTLNNPNIIRDIDNLVLITTTYGQISDADEQQKTCREIVDATKELIDHLRALN